MYRRAVCKVYVDGQDITSALAPRLISIRVSDSAGAQSGTASIEVDDTDGVLFFPTPKASVRIFLGWEGEGVDQVFNGTVDDIRSRGSRGGGRTISIGAKEVDTTGKAKQGQHRHFDDMTVIEILTRAAEGTGVTEVSVRTPLDQIRIPYAAMRGESFMAFGQRIAREIGGTFKIVGTRATVVPRNGTDEFPTVTATWGQNLVDWDVAPYQGRNRFKRSRSRYYDRKAAKWVEVETETELDDSEASAETYFDEPDEETAKRRTASNAKESERKGGEGSVTIEGDVTAQPEAKLQIQGARPGIDGLYRIDSVEHEYSRSGWTTRLGLKRPDKATGKDNRPASKTTPTDQPAVDFGDIGSDLDIEAN